MEPSINNSIVKFGGIIDGASKGNLFSHKSENNTWAVNFTGIFYGYDEVSANFT